MAKVKVKYNGEEDFLDLFYDDYKLASKSKNELVYVGKGEDGEVKRIVFEGSGFVVKNGMLKKGAIDEIDFLNHNKKTLVELDDVHIKAKQLNAVMADSDITPLLQLIYAGNDKISSSAYSTSIFTGAGNDQVKFTGRGWAEFIDGPGADKYIGSTFNRDIDNAVTYAHTDGYGKFGAPAGIDADMTTGKVTDPWGFIDTLRNINVITGTMFDDMVESGGTIERFRFRGLAGDDTFIGNTFEDTIDYRFDARHGGIAGVTINLAEGWAIDGFGDTDTLSGIDRAIGTAANDTIIGGDGRELLEGWQGDDTLTGGGDADIFRFRDGFGNDLVTDFTVGEDRLRMNDISDLFDGFEGLEIQQVGDDTVIRVEGDEDNSITLENVDASTLTEADFII